MPTRRSFLKAAALASATLGLGRWAGAVGHSSGAAPLYEISLAQWSLHRRLFDGDLDNLDFAATARNAFDIGAVEYVNQFFADRATDTAYLQQMKRRADEHGVTSLLIMCDGEGRLGDADPDKRRQAVENHHKWVDAARRLGCHSIRVNARSSGSWDEQKMRAADGLRSLSEFADDRDINVVVENHGGLSSNGDWLTSVIEEVDHPRCGTLPDFGNFEIRDGETYDPYKGVRQMMPYATGVSAKSFAFDENGRETSIDYERMMRIVVESGYSGHVGIEYEGDQVGEMEGIRKTKALLERTRTALAEQGVASG